MRTVYRQKFSECCEAIFRELGFPLPEMTHDDLLPLGMELEYEGTTFELIHFPSDMPSRVLVNCFLGKISQENILNILKNIMEMNLILVRASSTCFGINSTNNTLQCMYYESLDECNHVRWLDKMKETAKNAAEVRDNCFNRALVNVTNGKSDHISILA